VHVVRYEDCLAKPVATFGDALAAGGTLPDEVAVRIAVAKCSFEHLRAQEERAGFGELEGHGPFFRRGTAGGWQGELTPDLARHLEDAHGEVMARFGYL